MVGEVTRGMAVGQHELRVYFSDKLRENPFRITEFKDVERNVPYLGERQPLFRHDVTGDGKGDSVILYNGGHAFYSGSHDFDQGGFHLPTFRRIYPGTQEADYLHQLRPDFKLARPAQR